MTTHWDELIIVIAIGVLVTVIGFGASRWRRADLNHIEEWGLAGRSFGTIVTWFLLGGDLYTAYTFVAVPGVVFAVGAYGLFALPYTILIYPLVFLTMPRLWQVSRNKGYVTGSDYVKDRFNSRFFALLIALTGLVATMPYIALQIFGIKVVLANIGISPEAALIIAFVVLALFTYVSGLRAPALIAVVKDGLIWLVVIVAVIYIPYKLGGFGSIFHIRPEHIARSELFFARHGDRAVLASRFVLGLRTWGSMLAGMARMPFWRFQLFSAIGGLAWAAVIGVAGYLLGSNLALLAAVIRAIGLGGLIVLVLIVVILVVAGRNAPRPR